MGGESVLDQMKKKVYRDMIVAVILVPFVIVVFGEIFSSLFNVTLNKTVAERVAYSFKPIVYVLYIIVVSFYFFVIVGYLKPLFDFLSKGEEDGEGDKNARKSSLKISWFLLIINPLFWILTTLLFYGLHGWKAPGGVPLYWSLLLKSSEGILSAFFTILVINNTLLKPKAMLKMTNTRHHEKDFFIGIKDYLIMGFTGSNFLVHFAYVMFYFEHRNPENLGLEHSFMSLIIIGIVFSLMGLGLVWLSRKEQLSEVAYLKQNLTELNERKIADLSSEIILLNFNEIGDLVEQFNRFIHKIEKRFHGMVQVAQKVENNAESVNMAANIFSKSVQNQANGTEEVLATLKNFSSMLERVGDQVKDQFQQISTISSSMDQLNSGVESIVANTVQVRQQATINVKSALQGIEIVGESVKHLHQMNRDLTEITQKIRMVEEETRHIDDILETIQGIADQTDMLSMNAAIEAAHAGKAGEGFTIVASEIRKLAEDSTESVHKIASFIGNIKQRVGEVVQVAGKSESTAQEGQLSADNARVALETIVDNLKETDVMTEHIEKLTVEQGKMATKINHGTLHLKEVSEGIQMAVTEQAQGSSEIVVTMQSIAEENLKEKDASSELFQQVDHLKEQSYELKTLIGDFKLRDDE